MIYAGNRKLWSFFNNDKYELRVMAQRQPQPKEKKVADCCKYTHQNLSGVYTHSFTYLVI